MASDNALVMPVQGQPLEYRHVAQLVGRDLGVETWGSKIEHVSFSSATEYAHTIRNRGVGGHLNVLKSTDGSAVLAVTDGGVTLATLNATTVNAATVNATTVNASSAVNASTANVGLLLATAIRATGATITTGLFGSIDATSVAASTGSFGTLSSPGVVSGSTGTFTVVVASTASVGVGLFGSVSATSVAGSTGSFGLVAASTGSFNMVVASTASFGVSTLGTAGATSLNVSGGGSYGGAVTFNGTLQANGGVQIGNTTADALTILATTTYTDATGTSVVQFVDTPNLRTVFGSAVAPTGASNDKVDIVGGRLYVVGATEQIVVGLRYSSSQTGTYHLAVTDQSAPSLLLKDHSGDEVASFGDKADTYQFHLTGVSRFSSNVFVSGKLAVGATAFSGTESFRVASGTSLFAGSIQAAGGIVLSGPSNIDGNSGTAGELRIGAVIVNAGSLSGSEKLRVNGTSLFGNTITINGGGGVTVMHTSALTAVSAGAGTASALPALPAIYLYENVNGTLYRRPLYN